MFNTGELDAKRLEFMSEIVAGASIFGVLVIQIPTGQKSGARA